MQKPNLFILGAPKCGTTSLVSWLGQHPEIFVSPKKEPHYFYTPTRKRPISSERYRAYFTQATPSHKFLAEASVWYLFSGTAAPGILSFNPKARFIVCLRNPVKMFPSLHAQQVFAGLEGEKDVEKAWALSDERLAGSFRGIKKISRRADSTHMAYKHSCLLGQQVETLLKKIPRAKIKFVLIEDMRDRPEHTFQEICDFLGIEDRSRLTDFVVLNTAQKPRSRKINKRLEWLERHRLLPEATLAALFRANSGSSTKPVLRAEFVTELYDHFRQDTLLLQDLIDRDLSLWLKH